MKHPPPWRNAPPVLLIMLCVLARPCASAEAVPAQRLDGFNVIEAAGHPFGSASAKLALTNARHLGAGAIAIIPFLWQPNPASPSVRRGDDMAAIELRAAIRDAHAMNSESAWQDWFANYRRALGPIARIAEEEKAEALVIGTELSQTTQQPQWNALIAETRRVYSGRLFYVAHNVEEAETVPFWDELDAIGVTLYPPLGADDDGDGRRNTMRAVAARLDALAARTRKSILVAEIGLRSAAGAAAKPWESAEERASAPEPALQAQVLADWLAILDRPSIQGVLIWRWFTDPDAGGSTDTDFTVQGKPAERVLKCAWTRDCAQTEGVLPQ
jgi:hypothetical protein